MAAPAASALVVRPEDLARAEQLAAIAITTAAQEKDAIDGLSFVQGLIRAVKNEHKGQRTPLKETLDKLDSSFKSVLGPLEAAETRIKGAMLDWRHAESDRVLKEQERVDRANAERERKAREDAEAEKRRVAEAAAAEARDAGFTDAEVQEYVGGEVKEVQTHAPVREVAPPPPAPTVRATLGAATVRKVWTYEIVDAKAVPHGYRDCEPSAGKLRAAVNAGVRSIEGVRIFEREDIAGRKAGA